MARSRIGVDEVLHLVPADPGAVAIVRRLDRSRSFLLLDRLALRRRRRIQFAHPHFLAVEEGHVADSEALVDGGVRRAEHFFQRDAVHGGHCVDQHRAQRRRQVVRSRLQPRTQPEGSRVEDAPLLKLLEDISLQLRRFDREGFRSPSIMLKALRARIS